MYEISHRFLPPVSDGIDALYGFDGPARIRFALGYGITDDLMVVFGRSNNTDNYDLQFKQKLFDYNSDITPASLSILAGFTVNTEVPQNIDRSAFDSDNMQFYGQAILNFMLFET